MKKIIATAFAASLSFAVIAPSQALPIAPLGTGSPDIVITVAGGCGPGWHRGPYGGCRRNWAEPLAHPCARGWHLAPNGRCYANRGW